MAPRTANRTRTTTTVATVLVERTSVDTLEVWLVHEHDRATALAGRPVLRPSERRALGATAADARRAMDLLERLAFEAEADGLDPGAIEWLHTRAGALVEVLDRALGADRVPLAA